MKVFENIEERAAAPRCSSGCPRSRVGTSLQRSPEVLLPLPERGLPQAKLRQLAQGSWIGEHLNVLITGSTGVGKRYLGCALGQLACRRGHRVAYRRVPRFFEEASLAKADGSYTKLMASLAKADVLILDSC